jgi:hypothetical protein
MGMTSLRSRNCFAGNSVATDDKSVILPSGRGRLEVNPEPTKSSAITTSGTVVVRFFRALLTG